MSHINVTFVPEDAPQAWPDLEAKQAAGQVQFTEALNVSVYPDATVSGAPSVCMRFDQPDGSVIIAQVTVRNLNTLLSAVRGRLEYLGIDQDGKSTAPIRTDTN